MSGVTAVCWDRACCALDEKTLIKTIAMPRTSLLLFINLLTPSPNKHCQVSDLKNLVRILKTRFPERR